MKKYIEILKELSEATGLSGEEYSVAQIIKKYVEPLSDEVYIDNLGSLVAVKRGKGIGKLMISTHIDEVGMVVSDVTKEGFIKMEPRGGVDPKILLGHEVYVHTKNGKLLGVIGAVPPHLSANMDRTKVPSFDDLTVDVGLPFEKISRLVKIGDTITYKQDFVELLNHRVSGKSFDDRASALASIWALNELQRINNDIDVYFLFSTQEEVGTKGAKVGAYSIDPDIAIAIDVNFAKQPGSNHGVKMGEGPTIGIGPNYTPKIWKDLLKIAEDKNIKYQKEADSRPGGTDAGPIQVSRNGVATELFSIPLRNMHTSVETLDMNDIRELVRWLVEYIISIDSEYMEGLKWS
jgi:putative aminopeptidase FrvX